MLHLQGARERAAGGYTRWRLWAPLVITNPRGKGIPRRRTVWGLDILGPFPRAPGGYRYLYVAMDKFTKWAEVEAVSTIPAGSAVKFIKGLVS